MQKYTLASKYSFHLVAKFLRAICGSPYIVFVSIFWCMASCYTSGGIYVGMCVCLYNM